MKVTFEKAFAALYDQFGDEAITWTRQKITAYLDNRFDGGRVGAGDVDGEVPRVEIPDLTLDQETNAGVDDADYQDGEAFEAGVAGTLQDLTMDTIVSPEQVVDAVMNLVVIAGEVRKFEEAQVTKRVGIAADRDIALAQIKAQQDLLTDYLERSFDERAENFSKLFEVVDEALETHNMTALALSLESVIQLATSSPFKDLRTVEETAEALSNPDHKWEF